MKILCDLIVISHEVSDICIDSSDTGRMCHILAEFVRSGFWGSFQCFKQLALASHTVSEFTSVMFVVANTPMSAFFKQRILHELDKCGN